MDKTLNTEPEMGPHDDTPQEIPEGQAAEAPESVKNGPETDPLKKIKDELAEAKEKYLRLYAEFENHRRRTAKERLEMIQGANEQLLTTLLPVLDDFDRAEKVFREKPDKESEGFFLIQNKFRKILELQGVKSMDTAKESDFNADLHEAITQIPVTDEKLKGKVVDVVEKGYQLGERVIRFAKVVVGN